MCSFFNNFKDNKKSCLRKLSGSVNSSPLDQMAANLADDISKCIFVSETFCILIKTSLCLFLRFQLKITQFGLDNGLAPTRWQAIIWTNAELIHWCLYSSLGGDKLTDLQSRMRQYIHNFF